MNTLSRLKLARLNIGLSQHEVEARTGIHQSTLSLYERSFRSPPNEHRRILAKVYQMEEVELFDGK